MNLSPKKIVKKDHVIIEAKGVGKIFQGSGKQSSHVVLDKIDLTLREGEFVALLGRSGSGKSTLLRILAGLTAPTQGQVMCEGKLVEGANPNIAMVFQSFALLPWLTVLDNVLLGLRARRVPLDAATRYALDAIDMVGLDGFETAFPKELSGGMKQRVGFARALVMNPKVLFMDEPFSALDVLTAENLRGEISSLWERGQFSASSVLMVTHNIEEAVYLADRVVILGSSPGHIRGIINIDLPRPRDRKSDGYQKLTEQIYAIMTNPTIDVEQAMAVAAVQPGTNQSPLLMRLPHTRAGSLGGFLEMIAELGGSTKLSELAQDISLPVDELVPLVDATVLLGFGGFENGVITLTPHGLKFAESDILKRKVFFREQVLEHIPIIKTMMETLRTRETKSMNAEFFLDILDDRFPVEEAERQFSTAVDWARFAEILEYDSYNKILYDSNVSPDAIRPADPT